MNYLVDTHCLIWSLLDPDKLHPTHRDLLLDVSSTKFVSKISYWEIALKYSLGKLSLKGITPERLLKVAFEAGYQIYDISEDDLVTSYQLASSKTHRDPFDRLLVWQCIRNSLILVSVDKRMQEYTGHGLKLARLK
ncbi:MAG TPA: type II toxin-antitoxin system VapC family toxin [Candidatus Kryptobacter bacterium]|nr:type II toxin-antitoxin system VapC family toxin [Candidatus Kryptobacter bacterium]